MFIAETDRLILRPLGYDDLADLADILADPEVMRYSLRGVCDRAATLRFIDWCVACYRSHGLGPWALLGRSGGELLGFCGLGPEPVGEREEINLGYRLARRYWHQGFATEAVDAVLTHGFQAKRVESVVAIIEPGNVASLRVVEKAGFGDYRMEAFHDRPARMYRMSVEQWRQLGKSLSRLGRRPSAVVNPGQEAD
ncbi:GNAT family N-acetyltransferase [Marinobacter mobilis]|uniref:GNAT family N-acetyltransferase n=1 Tax=Marinobacter mobilis TaxID=488533 RepID=UPI0035C70259